MTDWFANLERREQWFVGTGAIAVLLIVFWGLVWTPLDTAQRRLETSVTDWQRSLNDLQAIASALTATQNGSRRAPADSSQSPMVIVDQTLSVRGLNSAVQRRQPTPNGIRVEFENVAFDQLVLWLGDLSARHGMNVQAGSLSLSGRAGPGRINASLTLERST